MFAIIDNFIIDHSPPWYRTATSQTIALGIVFFWVVSIASFAFEIVLMLYVSLLMLSFSCIIGHVSSLHILLFNSMREAHMDHLWLQVVYQQCILPSQSLH